MRQLSLPRGRISIIIFIPFPQGLQKMLVLFLKAEEVGDEVTGHLFCYELLTILFPPCQLNDKYLLSIFYEKHILYSL